MMNFNLLRDIIKHIRQFYYFKLNLHAQHGVTMYVIIFIMDLPLTVVMLILHLFSLRKSSRLGTYWKNFQMQYFIQKRVKLKNYKMNPKNPCYNFPPDWKMWCPHHKINEFNLQLPGPHCPAIKYMKY